MKILMFLIPTLMLSPNTNAPELSEGRIKEVQKTKLSEVINVSADDLWEIVGPGFTDAYVWSTAIDHSEGKGEAQFEGATCNERYCDVNASGFDKISEKLSLYNSENRELKYRAFDGLPGFVTLAENHWEVIDLGAGKSQIRMTITMHMKPFMGWLMGGLFQKNLDKTLNSVMEDLKIYAETGEVSDAKKKRLQKLAAKKAA
ncbi:MAG: SRPBCC family protein [Croceimicrobium sp.]|nr:SRPBCC family protein [Bacteroidota bacterium]